MKSIKKFYKRLKRCTKKMEPYDVSLIKLATAAAVIIIIKLWPVAMEWVNNTNAWWFVLALVVFSIRPFIKFRSV